MFFFSELPSAIKGQDTVITFYLYNADQSGTVLTVNNLGNVDSQKPVVFLIHGWLTNSSTEWVQSAISKLASANNAIGVDWGPIANQILYPLSAAAAPLVGLYEILIRLCQCFMYSTSVSCWVRVSIVQNCKEHSTFNNIRLMVHNAVELKPAELCIRDRP